MLVDNLINKDKYAMVEIGKGLGCRPIFHSQTGLG